MDEQIRSLWDNTLHTYHLHSLSTALLTYTQYTANESYEVPLHMKQ